jgi:hypothetical protein
MSANLRRVMCGIVPSINASPPDKQDVSGRVDSARAGHDVEALLRNVCSFQRLKVV